MGRFIHCEEVFCHRYADAQDAQRKGWDATVDRGGDSFCSRLGSVVFQEEILSFCSRVRHNLGEETESVVFPRVRFP